MIERIGIDAIHEHDVALANRFRAGIGLEPSDSAIVCADLPGAAERLEAAGIVAAVRGGLLRTSWHLYNDEADVDRVLEIVAASSTARDQIGHPGEGACPGEPTSLAPVGQPVERIHERHTGPSQRLRFPFASAVVDPRQPRQLSVGLEYEVA